MLKHASAAFGAKSVCDISQRHVQNLLAAMSETHAPWTVTHVRGVISAVLKFAVADKALLRNVAEETNAPKIEKSEPTIITTDELVCLVKNAPDEYRALILLAGSTGMRWGEVAGLRVNDIDFLRRRLHVAQQVDPHGIVSPVKTASSRRTIAVSDTVLVALSEHVSLRRDEASELMFTAPQGGTLRYNNFRRRVWKQLTRQCEIEGLTFHDLRHSHAAHLIEQGAHIRTIQSRLGHSSIKTTLDTYGHLMEGMDELEADKLDAALRG